MDRISILHLSDLHMSKERLVDIKIVLNALFEDVQHFHEEEPIDYVCFTGDLIQRGDRAEEQFELVLDHLITPLSQRLGLAADSIFVIPGNHEIDRSRIDPVIEAGLAGILTDRDAVNNFMDKQLTNSHLNRILHFRRFDEMLHQKAQYRDSLCSTYVTSKGSSIIGFACLNSAWRCSGDDRGNLIVGERQVDRALKSIEKCDIKVALIHHPTFWLTDSDKPLVEARLSDFDIVLNGHLHDLGEKNVITGGHSTLYCSSGALFDGRSTYNGYSVIRLNPYTKHCRVHLREYFDHKRRAFDTALSVAEHGVVDYQLTAVDTNIKLSFSIVESVLTGFLSRANQALVSSILDDTAPPELDVIFVEPILSKSSEYVKEKADPDEDNVSLQKVVNSDGNVLFVGKKESGKTTLLHHLTAHYLKHFTNKFKVPFFVDLRGLPQGFDPIEKLMIRYVSFNSDYSLNPSKQDIINLLKSGSCILLFDNLQVDDATGIREIKKFVEKYPNNRYRFALNEDIFLSMKEADFPDLGCEYEGLYIHTLSRGKIRSLVQNWFGNREIDIEQFLSRTLHYLNHVGMPRTPFIVSLVLAICHQQEDYIPINEASVMEQFMEMLLEKLSVEETKTSSYDFRIKEDYLMNLAWHMVEHDTYELDSDQHVSFTERYFEDKGLDVRASRFKTLFFEKKILVRHEGNVYFRYRSIVEYYIAKKAQSDPLALSTLMRDENILNFASEINFVTGLARDRKDILLTLEDKVIKHIEGYLDALNYLDDYGLKIDIPFEEREVKEKLDSLRLDESERDKLLDIEDTNGSFDKQKVHKRNESATRQHGSEFGLFLLYGRVIRNSELVDRFPKARALQLFILCNCIYWAIIKKDIEDNFTKANFDSVFVNEDAGELPPELFVVLRDALKIGVPIGLQNIAAETVGTGKLSTVIKQLIEEERNEFMKFMLVFLYCDLKLPHYLAVIEKFMKSIVSKDILQISIYKLMHYYRTGHVSDKDAIRLESIIADGIARYKGIPKYAKGTIITDMVKKPVALSDFLSAK